MKLTTYKIKRDHDNETKFFFVNVSGIRVESPSGDISMKDAKGIGFQMRIKEYVYGISITRIK